MIGNILTTELHNNLSLLEEKPVAPVATPVRGIAASGQQQLPLHQGGMLLPDLTTPEHEILFGNTGPVTSGNRATIPYQIFSPLLTEELKRVSYFELMKTPPSIHQLFSHDFRELVNSLINIQKDSSLFPVSRQAPTVPDIKSSTPETSLTHQAAFTDFQVSNNPEISQTVAYNHLLHASGKETLHATTHPRKKQATTRQHATKQEQKPYFEKKGRKKTQNHSQKLLKRIISGLQNTSRILSKYVEQ